MFTGCGTALITPFQHDGSLDEAALRALVDRQIAAGINFLVPCGTTGESPTLSHAEHLRVVEITVEQARGRVPVVAGAGGYDTISRHQDGRRSAQARRIRYSLCYAVLQQADARRLVSALQGHRQFHAAAHHCLQRAGPHFRQCRTGHALFALPKSRTSSA